MSCVAITRRIGPVPIDVILEEVHRSELEITRNPIEFGADVTDHAYVLPKRLSLRGAHGSRPGAPGIIFGLDGSRAAAAYGQLILLQSLREPFSIVTGLKIYSDMLIESLEATRDPEKSHILDFRADLLQVIIVSSAAAPASSTQGKSPTTPGGPVAGSPADGRSGIGTGVNRGQISGTPAPTGATGGAGAVGGGSTLGGGGVPTVGETQNSIAYDMIFGG